MNATVGRNRWLSHVVEVVNEATVYGVDVYVAGTEDRIRQNAAVTIRQASGIPGWIGILDGDLTAYRDIRLELRREDQSTSSRYCSRSEPRPTAAP